MRSAGYKEEKKKEIMQKCFECYCDNGLRDTGIKELGKYCGMTSANLYAYFDNVDDLIVQSTAYCMAKVEDEFMALAPENPRDILRFIDEVPYWTAEHHGKKYRLMYQVYTHPKYVEHGKRFVNGVSERYTEYARELSPRLGVPVDILSGFIFIFVRAAVHFALFEDEYYMKMQMEALKLSVFSVIKNFKKEGIEKE
ncbi:TetR/AcrR family transcriptional regulator [Acetivibrio sp. MSJd-27]|uniref:TetR/AcrR family transcriptional regulator n=1 Tax=Acetivibrio sp. MSJd-27 TaxID=2841523 RepID=UPI001C1230C9|nr:TetR/AcrR family transcriptional regulator [Acetivibrio sp. MSJd-27]MBU5450821.1 TetR/AcrR family transcriptional regulator [Acetivibrio sp. MSJd-27]